jgi:hypothetical protein
VREPPNVRPRLAPAVVLATGALIEPRLAKRASAAR